MKNKDKEENKPHNSTKTEIKQLMRQYKQSKLIGDMPLIVNTQSDVADNERL